MFSVSVVIITATIFSTCVVAGHILQCLSMEVKRDFLILTGVEREKAEQVRVKLHFDPPAWLGWQ